MFMERGNTIFDFHNRISELLSTSFLYFRLGPSLLVAGRQTNIDRHKVLTISTNDS